MPAQLDTASIDPRGTRFGWAFRAEFGCSARRSPLEFWRWSEPPGQWRPTILVFYLSGSGLAARSDLASVPAQRSLLFQLFSWLQLTCSQLPVILWDQPRLGSSNSPGPSSELQRLLTFALLDMFVSGRGGYDCGRWAFAPRSQLMHLTEVGRRKGVPFLDCWALVLADQR